jgi:hypothetical protein
VRPSIDYKTFGMGTSEIVGGSDYNEVIGNAANAGKLPGGKKISGLKVNDVVYKNCCDFFKRIKESS